MPSIGQPDESRYNSFKPLRFIRILCPMHRRQNIPLRLADQGRSRIVEVRFAISTPSSKASYMTSPTRCTPFVTPSCLKFSTAVSVGQSNNDREVVCHHPIDFLRHLSVMTAQSCFDMCNRNVKFCRRQEPRQALNWYHRRPRRHPAFPSRESLRSS